MSDLLSQWEADCSHFSRASADYWEQFQRQLSVHLTQWDKRCQDFKGIVAKLPKHLRQSDLFVSVLNELESFEQNTLTYWNQSSTIQAVSHAAAEAMHNPAFQEHLLRLQTQLQSMSKQLSVLPAHPLFQKFVRGEPIYPERHKLQWRRKFFHAGNGMLFLYLFCFAGLSRSFLLAFGFGFMMLALTLELIRHISPAFNKIICKPFAPIMRSHEEHSINSATYYIVAMYLVYVFFPVNVAMLTLLYVAIGDPVAGIVGTRYGRHRIKPGVSWEGFLACFATCTVLTAVFSNLAFAGIYMSGVSLVVFSLTAGLIAALAESSFKNIDDNLVIPLFSAPSVYLLLRLFAA